MRPGKHMRPVSAFVQRGTVPARERDTATREGESRDRQDVVRQHQSRTPTESPQETGLRVISTHDFRTERGMTQLEVLRTSPNREMGVHLTTRSRTHLTIRQTELPNGQLQMCHAFSRGQIMR